MKAEELKQAKEIFRKVWISHFEHSKETDEQLEIICESHDYIFEAMEQYAAEVSREKLRDAFEQGYDHHNDPNKYYGFDEWMSKQQNNG